MFGASPFAQFASVAPFTNILNCPVNCNKWDFANGWNYAEHSITKCLHEPLAASQDFGKFVNFVNSAAPLKKTYFFLSFKKKRSHHDFQNNKAIYHDNSQ